MNTFTRGIRNAFRNVTRTISLVVILGISIGLALTMLVARQAVQQKINSVKSSVSNTVSIAPAGFQGFQGGGTPLTTQQLAKVNSLPHIVTLTETLGDRLTTSDTNLVSSITPGTLGKRQANVNSQSFGGGGGFAGFGGSTAGGATGTFSIPITVTGTTDPSTANSSTGGSLKITSGSQISGTSDKDVALVGSALASKNNLKVGSTFTAYGSTVTVAGIFDSGTTFGNSGIIMALPTVQRLSDQSGDVTAAVAQVDSISNLSTVVSEINKTLGSSNVDVTSSEDTANAAVAPLNSIKSISLYSLIGAVIAGSVIILLTMIMIVRERRREIGVIKAIGASNTRVIMQFMSEAVTLTILGAIIGLIIGVAGSGPVTNLLVTNTTTSTSVSPGGGGAGITLRRGGGGFLSRQFGAGGAFDIKSIHAIVGWDILLYSLAAALIIAIIGSAVASALIAKVRPAEVMRAE